MTIRARALKRRNKDLKEATAYLQRIRELGKKYFDKRHRIRREPLKPRMLILSHDTTGAMDISANRKLSFR